MRVPGTGSNAIQPPVSLLKDWSWQSIVLRLGEEKARLLLWAVFCAKDAAAVAFPLGFAAIELGRLGQAGEMVDGRTGAASLALLCAAGAPLFAGTHPPAHTPGQGDQA